MSINTRKLKPKLWHQTYLLNKSISKSLRDVVTRIFSDGKKDRLLDVGCGSTPYRDLFDPLVESYTGCDMYPLSKDVVACSADNLAFEDNFFDVVVNFQVLEHVEHPWLVVKECARVIKPGGGLGIDSTVYFPFSCFS